MKLKEFKVKSTHSGGEFNRSIEVNECAGNYHEPLRFNISFDDGEPATFELVERLKTLRDKLHDIIYWAEKGGDR